MRTFRNWAWIIPFAILMLTGCSGGQSPITPDNEGVGVVSSSNSHYAWGVFTFACDPEAGTIDVIPLRDASMHVNVLPLLEPPPLVYITIESLEFTGNLVETDIGLTHPYLGLTEFTGFDVCGIVFTHGSVSGFNDPDLVMAGEGDTCLLNPDGYSRWWNPAEFPHGGTVFNYVEGFLGTPSTAADYNTTLNGYKYFADGLGKDDPLTVLDLSKRGMFGAGQKHVRHYTIDLSGGLIFNYAIDACWHFPQGSPPFQAPDDFAPEANRPEAWMIEVTEVENTLHYEDSTGDAGGDLQLLIDVYDWFDVSLNQVYVESLAGLPYTAAGSPVGGGEGYSTYQVDLNGDALHENGDIDLLITVQCEKSGYGNLLPGKLICAYFSHSVYVAGEQPDPPSLHILTPDGGEEWVINYHYDIEWESTGEIENVKLEYSKDDFNTDINEIIAATENDGSFDWQIPNDPSTTVIVRVSDVDDSDINDISDDDFTITDQCTFTDPVTYQSYVDTGTIFSTGFHFMQVDSSRLVGCRPSSGGNAAFPWLAVYDESNLSVPIDMFQVPGGAYPDRPWCFEVDSNDRIFFFMAPDYPSGGSAFDTIYYIDWDGSQLVDSSLTSFSISTWLDPGELGAKIWVDSDDDVYALTHEGKMLKFDHSNAYAGEQLFDLDGDPGYPEAKELDFLLAEEINAFFIYTGYGDSQRAIYKVSYNGTILASETDIWAGIITKCGHITGGIGDDGDCRLVVLDGHLHYEWGTIRYDYELDQKASSYFDFPVMAHPGNSLHFKDDGTILFNTDAWVVQTLLVTYDTPSDW